MFKARNNKSDKTPRKVINSNPGSPITELKECVAKLNAIIESVWTCNIHGDHNKSPSKQLQSPRNPSNGSSNLNGNLTTYNEYDNRCIIDARFVTFKPKQEQDMVELLRRIAEIVVQGEQRAAADESSTSSEVQELSSENNNNSIFEFFCEANVLGTIINIITGVAFFVDDEAFLSGGLQQLGVDDDGTNRTSNGNVEKDLFNENADINSKRFLPPTAVAIQAIQSISILVQNVAKVTSLYFILSNNRVNDLIDLPLEYYSIAEQQQNGDREGISHKISVRKKLQSAEMSELTTLFISFLKSLAMRMNPETLQFFLTYPMQTKGNVDFSTIQFPLYRRALEFCNPDEDTFVRVTAMNICLNTLRLATNGNSITMEDLLSIHQNQSTPNSNSNESHRPDKSMSPDGCSLHLKNALPFRERLAIAHFVCLPAHVQALTSATFTKIGQLCGSIEEIMRSMDRIDWTLSKTSDLSPNERTKKEEDLQIHRIKLVKQFHDISADFQDEIYLLEDVFAVGLVPLNEQIIEMMFAGVVYPLVLQPLQLYRNNNNTNSSNINQVADISLAKASFFVIASIFHYISHKPFLHLLITALLHPLAPDASKSLIQTDSPTVVTVTGEGRVQIKIDEKNETSLESYSFGRQKDGDHAKDLPGTKLQSQCTYVLSPALAQLYQAEFTPFNLRKNSYRRSILACLSGTDGMGCLQPLAIYSIDAILGTIKPYVLKNVMYGANSRPEWIVTYNSSSDCEGKNNSESKNNVTDNFMVEIIASICRSVMTTSSSTAGKLNFLSSCLFLL